jgi:hypothetical protein
MDAVVVPHQRPRKKDLEQIASRVVLKYPDALVDVIDGLGSILSSLSWFHEQRT